jgi:uncharacterized protein (TIGR03437 family)
MGTDRMKLVIIPAFFLLLAVQPASAIVTLGLSNQNFGLTGIGGNTSGEGQSKMTWGSCAFDGTNTNCTLSGPFIGLGPGGTYSFVITYAGNGPFPLNAVSQSAGSDLFTAQATNSFSLVITLAQANGPAISFYTFANFSFFFSSPTCTGVPATSCGVGQVGLTPGATIIGPITGSFDPTPSIRANSGVISASGYGGFSAIAPSTWVEIYGVNLATTRSQIWAGTDFVGNQAPSALGGTTVTVAGKPAYVLFVSPGQVNVQVPSGVAAGPQPVVVTTAGGSSTPYTVTVNTAEPGLLAIPAFVLNGKQYVVALFSNTLNFVFPVAIAGSTTARARAGDNITLYGIGFGLVTPDIPAGQLVTQGNQLQQDIKITFGGTPATITYAGLGPANVGLYQFNVVVPSGVAGDTVPVAFTLGGVASTQNLLISIQN